MTKSNLGEHPKNEHHHVYDLPRKLFPRAKANKAGNYADELGRLIYGSLAANRVKLQRSGQMCIFNIKSVTKKEGYRASQKEVIESVEEFVYHYENFCYRAYSGREKLIRFLNEILEIGFEPREIRIKQFAKYPIIKLAGLQHALNKFEGKNPLAQVIDDRHSLTHRLFYHDQFDHLLIPKSEGKQVDFKAWSRHINNILKKADSAFNTFVDIDHEISDKIVKYKSASK